MGGEKGLIYIIHNVLFCANADPVMATAGSWNHFPVIVEDYLYALFIK